MAGPSRSLMIAAVVVAMLLGAVQPLAAVDDVEPSATLTDGVIGLATQRTTAIESEVWAIETVGSHMLVGGAFLEVVDRSTYRTTPWPYFAAFDPTTGEHLPWFHVHPDGPVYDIVDLGDGRALITGEFSTVNGVPGTDKLAVIDTTTGQVDTSWNVRFDTADATVVRAAAIHEDWLYVTGAFNRANGGGVAADTRGLARFSVATGRLDPTWTPELQGGDGFGIGVDDGGRVFVGGYFETVNGVAGTETLAAIRPSDGELVAGWNHGFPYTRCVEAWRNTCGAVNGLAVHDGRVFVAGAKHFWAALEGSDGTVLVANEITNDGQSVDLVDGKIVIGCHCETPTFSDEFNDIAHRYIRIIDPATLSEVTSPTVDSRGAAGGWAAGDAADGCLWTGGNFSSTFVDGTRHPAWNLLRFCPGDRGSNPPLQRLASEDATAPSTPGVPVIDGVRGATVDLTWSASADASGQIVYLVYRDGVLVARTPTSSYADQLLDYESEHVWQVAAIDPAGNQSELSGRSAPVAIGARINIARQATVTQSSDYDSSTTADRAVDGLIRTDPDDQLPSRTGNRAADTDSWIDIDLGSVRNVDTVVLHPRRDEWFRESNNRPRLFHDTTPIDAVTRADAAIGGHSLWIGDVSRSDATPRIDVVSIAEPVRHIRIFGSLSRVSFDEIEVFTAESSPTPAPPAADDTDPVDPRWSRVVVRGEHSVLEWGGATDDTGVAFYEVAGPNGSTWRTASTRLSVGAPGFLAREFRIVAVDAAGNRSGDLAGPQPVAACSIVRDGTSVMVTWTPDGIADRFIVRRSVDGGSVFWRGSADGATSEFSDSDRAGALVYSVESAVGRVSSEPVNCNDEGPVAPTGLRVTREENRLVVINYAAGGQTVEVERNGAVIGTDSDDWFVDSGLDVGTGYEYRVRFVGGPWSTAVTATTTGQQLVRPQSCSVTLDAGMFSVNWSAVDGAEAYVVERRVDGGSWWWRGRVSDTSFDDTGRQGTVEYRVRAIAGSEQSTNRTCS